MKTGEVARMLHINSGTILSKAKRTIVNEMKNVVTKAILKEEIVLE